MRVINLSRAVAALAALAITGGCATDSTEPPEEPSFVLGTLTVLPQNATIEAGQDLKLQVRVIDDFGHHVEGASILWMSSNPAVASVTAAGMVQGLSVGHAVISAQAITMTGLKSHASTVQVRRSAPRPDIGLKRPNMEPWKRR